jgi:hypothetical protein
VKIGKSMHDTGRDLCQLSIDAPLPDAQPLKS